MCTVSPDVSQCLSALCLFIIAAWSRSLILLYHGECLRTCTSLELIGECLLRSARRHWWKVSAVGFTMEANLRLISDVSWCLSIHLMFRKDSSVCKLCKDFQQVFKTSVTVFFMSISYHVWYLHVTQPVTLIFWCFVYLFQVMFWMTWDDIDNAHMHTWYVNCSNFNLLLFCVSLPGKDVIFTTMTAAFSELDIPHIYSFLFFLGIFLAGIMFLVSLNRNDVISRVIGSKLVTRSLEQDQIVDIELIPGAEEQRGLNRWILLFRSVFTVKFMYMYCYC